MKTIATLIILALTLGAWAADNAAVAPQQATSLKPQAASFGTDAITIPQMLSYQGKLTDTFGLPAADTIYAVRFRLYAQPSGGTQFWEENQNVRTTGGLFSVLLGSVTPIGTVPDAGALYLGMAVAGGAEMTPRLRIASAAYAYLTARSANSDLLQGRDTTTFSRNTHSHDAAYVNEGQADAVTGAMLVNGAVLTADVGDTAVTMAKIARAGATTGQVVKWSGSAWAPGPDNTGGGSGVTNVYQDTGIVCVPNPITSTGNVKLNLTYADGRYVNEAQSNSVTSAMITDANVTSADIRDTTVNTAELKDGSVTSAKILNATIAAADLNQMGAASGQVMKWTGSAWAPRNDSIGGGGSVPDSVPGSFAVTTDLRVYGKGRIGLGNSNAGNAAFVAGEANTASANYSSVSGGADNSATGVCAQISGGGENRAAGDYSTVGGGGMNYASGGRSTVAGGSDNEAYGLCAAIGGGLVNTAGDAAADTAATVAGGYVNVATGKFATVGGGRSNVASGNWATVSGGAGDTASGVHSMVGGGRSNDATGDYATVGGGDGNAAETTYATVGGGYQSDATGYAATVGGGYWNHADSAYATVGGGQQNEATGRFATVGGGWGNRANVYAATVGGGHGNAADSFYSTVAGGRSNYASGYAATVGGGYLNFATGSFASVLGGTFCLASGNRSFAAGSYAKAHGAGSFVWSDSCGNSGDSVGTTTANRWVARARGGVYFYTDLDKSTGSYLSAGGSSWNSVSDSMTKENFRSVDKKALLEALARMRVRDYNLKTQDASIRHIGPVAQDFHNAFGFGESNTAINMEDADGIALAAIQALYEQNQALSRRVAELEAKLGRE